MKTKKCSLDLEKAKQHLGSLERAVSREEMPKKPNELL